MALQKIVPCLWFDSEAEEAAHFYVSVFKNARIGRISRYGKEGFEIHGRPEGSVMTVEFEIEGQTFTALNGGPQFALCLPPVIMSLVGLAGMSRWKGGAVVAGRKTSPGVRSKRAPRGSS